MDETTVPFRVSGINECPPEACDETAACFQAVTRTYGLLKRAGAEERVAYEAAQTVYAWHHPEVPRARVPYVIADWLP